MIIGKGLIAKAFEKYKSSGSIIIFASGVSNSKETEPSEFKRERKLLDSCIGKGGRLVYFSTCSIDDPSLQASPYVLHKKAMEKHIQKSFPNNIIFRLPIVVGNNENPNTFFNYFKDRISKGLGLTIDTMATRYIIDAGDLSAMLSDLIENGHSSQVINVALDNKMHVKDIVGLMEDIIGKAVAKEFTGVGSSYDIDNSLFVSTLSNTDDTKKFIDSSNYNYELLKKYLD